MYIKVYQKPKQNQIHPMTFAEPRKGNIPQIFSQMNIQFLVN